MATFKGNNRASTIVNGVTHFVLHSTSIVKYYPNSANNDIVLNSGGYMTATTKKAMNEVGEMLGFKVYQKAGTWFVEYRGETLDYSDNMILN